MNLTIEKHASQKPRWPAEGRHILAQFNEESVIVYQAYRPSIGRFAVEHQHFGGEFGLNRMSWIKPNFLWMMYRCGWGQKQDQEVVLAVRLHRWAFDEILRRAVQSSFPHGMYANENEWKSAVAESDVRLQWDPDHGPTGEKLSRRAIQLGLRGQTLLSYAKEWLIEIQDISEFVSEQGHHVVNGALSELETPKEEVYPVKDIQTAKKLGVIF